jgi:endonuclease III
MTKKERYFCYKYVKRVISHNPVPLDHKDSYTLLIAVLLSAHAQMLGVKPNYAVVVC